MDDLMEQPAETLDSDAAENNAAEDDNLVGHADETENLGADSQEQTEEEDEEVEIGDKKVAMPKSLAEVLKAERMKASDYTQKTQQVAEERRQVAAEREQVQKYQQQSHVILNEIADVRSIDRQLEDIEKMNLAQYVQTDPQGVMEWQEKRRSLESQRMQLVGSITQKQNDHALNEQQTFAKQIQDAEVYLAREKGITPERVKEAEKYAAAHGMDARAYARTIIGHPQVLVFAHKAELYDALMKKQAPKPPPVAQAKPAIRVGSNASVKKDIATMTDKEYAEMRRQQIKNRN